jgi:hypothetical protein
LDAPRIVNPVTVTMNENQLAVAQAIIQSQQSKILIGITSATSI